MRPINIIGHVSILWSLALKVCITHMSCLRPLNSKITGSIEKGSSYVFTWLRWDFSSFFSPGLAIFSSHWLILLRCVDHIYPIDSLDSTLFCPFHSIPFFFKSKKQSLVPLSFMPIYTLNCCPGPQNLTLCQSSGSLHAWYSY